jgi:hypothetical protein
MEAFKQFSLAYYDACGDLGFLRICDLEDTLRDDGQRAGSQTCQVYDITLFLTGRR